MLISLKGQIETVTYASEKTGFAVVQVALTDQPDRITVVGHLMTPTPGEILEMHGEWVDHAKFGRQFRLVKHRTIVPTTLYGIKKYLGSGMIAGLGPKIAERIVAKFGEQTLDILENDLDQLSAVKGIGAKRLERIKSAWRTQSQTRDGMLFLQSHDVGPGHAIKILRQYGDRTVAQVKSNPFRLASDIFGIGFNTADRIASRLGFSEDAPQRIAAGLLYLLSKLSDEGHVFYPYKELLAKAHQTLNVAPELIADALGQLATNGKIVVENQGEYRAVYLNKLFQSEAHIAQRLATLLATSAPRSHPAVDESLDWIQRRLSMQLAEQQIQAVKTALTSKVMILTGGPGTGKTTLIKALIKIHSRQQLRIKLAAPTGRAAKRMTTATGHSAATIHRLLEYSFQKGGFQRNANRPLICDLLIVDEASMIDTLLMHHLMQAIPDRTALILVGDVDQLPSVGPGRVLSDLLASKTIPTVRLTQIFRQARTSRIITNAHRINHGHMPNWQAADQTPLQDFFFIEQNDPQKVLNIILKLVADRIPRRFGYDPTSEIQVLTPMHKGLVGAQNLNTELQQALNPGENRIMRGGQNFRIGDKIMQIRNNYDKEVFNGDLGIITQIRPHEQSLTAHFDDRLKTYNLAELDEIVLAYAISVHKSQGSEYPAVVLPILTQHYILLQRNLIYTAVTRGRKLVVMVGSRQALAMAINNNRTQARYTYLGTRLQHALTHVNP